MDEIIRCPKCGSTRFVLPIMKTGHLIIDTEDVDYQEFDDADSELSLIKNADFICAECEAVIENYTLIHAKLKEFF